MSADEMVDEERVAMAAKMFIECTLSFEPLCSSTLNCKVFLCLVSRLGWPITNRATLHP